MMFLKEVLVWLVITLIGTNSLPQGAPEKICRSMLPEHPGSLPQNSVSPFSIVPRRLQGKVIVVVRSLLGTPFQGFMIQGRSPDGRIVGTFENMGEFAHTINCDNERDTTTHSSPNPKNVLEVQWTPPPGYDGPIIFNGTIAQDYGIYWVGVQSEPFRPSSSMVDDDVPQLSSPSFFNTPPTFVKKVKQESAMDFDPFYTGCASTKLCFGSPNGCVKTESCKAVVAVSVAGDKFDFELKGYQGAKWVGVGLSDDNKMGSDSVIECALSNNTLDSFLSWTTGKGNYGATRTKNQLGIRLLNHSFINDVIYCKVRRDAKTLVNGLEFDLSNKKYYLLVAAGYSATGQGVGYHDVTYLPSGSLLSLADVSEVEGASRILIRIHGAFMLAAWIGAVSIGTLLARYYRKTWTDSSMCGKDVWFGWHRLLMMFTWALTIAAIVLIWVELGTWSNELPHAILGTITTILCFLQPIGAFFRPHPGASKRPLFNWMHWLGGNLAHIAAIVTIFFAVKLGKAELPHFVDYILAGYVVFHVIVHLSLSVMGCLSERSSDGRVSSFPMKDLNTSRNTTHMNSGDYPYGVFRKAMLWIYATVVIVITIVLILITVLAPIEETWKTFRNRNVS